ncbi:MAG: hypothetical protein AAFX79_04505 [Planctomycetota bacterium]
MNPFVRDALIAGVLPGTIAVVALTVCGALLALRRGPLEPEGVGEPLAPRSVLERVVLLASGLALAAAVVLSMRTLEPYDGWWPINVANRIPAVLGLAGVFAALIAAGPSRWWFVLVVSVLGAGLLNWGLLGPLPAFESSGMLWGWVAANAAITGLAVLLAECGLRHATQRHGRLMPLLVLPIALVAVPGVLFFSSLNVPPRQYAAFIAIATSALLVCVVLKRSAGRMIIRGLGAFVVLATAALFVHARTLGAASPWPVALAALAAIGLFASCLLATRIKRWWLLGIVTFALTALPLHAAVGLQRLITLPEDDGGTAADYGY